MSLEPQVLARALSEVRQRDHLLWVRLYCEASGCPAREIDIRLKDYDNEAADMIAGRLVKCPVCGEAEMSLHYIVTNAERERAENKEAIGRVNVLRWIRDHTTEKGEPVTIPLSAYDDETLPP